MLNQIHLRGLKMDDLVFLEQIENNFDYWELSDTTEPFSRELLVEYIKASDKSIEEVHQQRFVIVISDETAVGFIDLFDFNYLHSRAGVGIIIEKKYRGRGFASEALKLICDYAKSKLKLHQLYANIVEDNNESIALFEKMGFEQVAIKRDWHYSKGNFKNELLYQLIL